MNNCPRYSVKVLQFLASYLGEEDCPLAAITQEGNKVIFFLEDGRVVRTILEDDEWKYYLRFQDGREVVIPKSEVYRANPIVV